MVFPKSWRTLPSIISQAQTEFSSPTTIVTVHSSLGEPPRYVYRWSPEVLRMTEQELKSIQQRNFKELKKKVGAWEKADIIDEIAAKSWKSWAKERH